MNNFDKVIGYDAIKNELLQICDMVKNKSVYEKLGAKFPRGVLLYGDPGLGKTLMAKCFIAECNLETFTIRKTKNENFVEHISETFEKAKEKHRLLYFLTIWTSLQMKTISTEMQRNILQYNQG